MTDIEKLIELTELPAVRATSPAVEIVLNTIADYARELDETIRSLRSALEWDIKTFEAIIEAVDDSNECDIIAMSKEGLRRAREALNRGKDTQ